MDVVLLILSLIIVFLLVTCLVYLFFYQPKKQENLLKLRLDSLSNQQKEINQQQEKILKLRLDSLSNQQKEASKKQEELLKLRLDSLGQELKTSKESLGKINNLLLAPFERGRLGNIQLDRLLSLYLPKDDKIYQLEYTLKKKNWERWGFTTRCYCFWSRPKEQFSYW